MIVDTSGWKYLHNAKASGATSLYGYFDFP